MWFKAIAQKMTPLVGFPLKEMFFIFKENVFLWSEYVIGERIFNVFLVNNVG